MDSFDIKKFIKKPAVIIVAAVLAIVLVFSLFFGGGDGQDPSAKASKNLSNRHQALVTLIDQYSSDVRSATLRANLSQVSIILTADKNEIDAYIKVASQPGKKITATFSIKPSKELIQRLDKAKIANNLDSEIKTVVESELNAIGSATEKMKRDFPGEVKLVALTDRLILNTQTMLTRLDEAQ